MIPEGVVLVDVFVFLAVSFLIVLIFANELQMKMRTEQNNYAFISQQITLSRAYTPRTATLRPEARFSKVPKLYGPFSDVTIPFGNQERRAFNSSNFTVNFLFVTLKTCQKIGFPKQAVGNFTDGFSGPKRFRDFRETGPWGPCFERPETLRAIFGCYNSLCIS